MTRLAIVIVACFALVGGAYYLGRQHDARDEAEADLNTERRVNDALDDSRDCGAGWFDRLRCSGE